jgi:Fe2+ transport system protein B
MKREMADRRWFVTSLVLTLVVSYLVGLATYRLAIWFGL